MNIIPLSSVELLLIYTGISKPLMEKKRRARINVSLEQLKALLEKHYSHHIRKRKLEKADILELSVKYMKSLQNSVQVEEPQQKSLVSLHTKRPVTPISNGDSGSSATNKSFEYLNSCSPEWGSGIHMTVCLSPEIDGPEHFELSEVGAMGLPGTEEPVGGGASDKAEYDSTGLEEGLSLPSWACPDRTEAQSEPCLLLEDL
ncbi:Transcription factor HES-3 [Chelonia mydas]|uniref:Transcription factor HES-3 n=1 Tax=Chelonia mydas TaxID=8469 RepID=M7BCH8_CHEMY|nr:Transcription factor HES-3 [Chelonia mydas]